MKSSCSNVLGTLHVVTGLSALHQNWLLQGSSSVARVSRGFGVKRMG